MKILDPLDTLLQYKPELIREFYDKEPKQKKLSEEIAHLLKREISALHIEFSAVTHRTKSLKSCCEKIVRNNYSYRLDKINDLSGVRLVYLYKNDKLKIENIIENVFQVLKKEDKEKINKPNRFGYVDLSYIVKLKEESSGNMYYDLKNLVCEIQVRTTLQDAWAIVSHHLCYKQESSIPKEFQRDLNALVGVFELADDKFSDLKIKREKYRKEVVEDIDKDFLHFAQRDVNHDTLYEYLKWKLPEYETRYNDVELLIKKLDYYSYLDFVQINEVIARTKDAVEAFGKDTSFTIQPQGDIIPFFSSTIIVELGIALLDTNFLNDYSDNNDFKQHLKSYKNKILPYSF